LNATKDDSFVGVGYCEIHYALHYMGNKVSDAPFIKSQKRQFVNNAEEISDRG